MRVLGISAFYHDSAAVLVEDGRIVAAVQEERFSRVKHDAGFPRGATAWCLTQAGGPLDAIVYYEKPLLKFERILATATAVAPRGFRAFAAAIPSWLQQKLWLPRVLEDELAALGVKDVPVKFVLHHEAHAASAFLPSPFSRAAILTLDGVGEWSTTTLGRGADGHVELLQELRFPHSLGLLYSAFTQHCGFRVNSGEYKLMGLAPYGRPSFVSAIHEHLIDLKADGSFRLNLDAFGYLQGQRMTNDRFAAHFGPARAPEAPLSERQCDLSRSVQEVTEEIMLRLARTLHAQTGEENLCLAGGVALNCVANARLRRDGPFRDIWVQPAAGDAGGALGAALLLANHEMPTAGRRRVIDGQDAMQGALLGPEFSDAEIAAVLAERGIAAECLPAGELHQVLAARLEAGAVVGFFAGRAEFGPRALGSRSILADARRPEMQEVLNRKIKLRESFRPFAPVVLAERAAEYFDLSAASPYMLFTAPVTAARRRAEPDDARSLLERAHEVRSEIPAVTHVDYSARVQTVHRELHPALHAVLTAFADRTGCPVLVNTSFNVRGEPPVCHPREALDGFLRTDIDVLALGSFLIEKHAVSPEALAAAAAAAPAFAAD